MKKCYSKPEIAFEDFSLSVSIAAGCEQIVNSGVNVCKWYISFGSGTREVFNDSVSGGCQTTPAEAGFDTLCYHVPDGYNTFTS